MPIPSNIGTGTVTGTYEDLQTGAPLSGSVTFVPSVSRFADPALRIVLLAQQRTQPLDQNGSFSVTLVATNDTDMQPVGFTYTVTENINGRGSNTFSMALPQGGTFDTSQMLATDPSAGTITYVGGGTGPVGPGGSPSGAAGGDLSGTYPNPQVRAGAITDSHVAFGANIQKAKIAGLGSAAGLDVPAFGNAATNQVVKGDDTRLTGGPGGGGLTSFNTRTGPAITLLAGDVTPLLGTAATLDVPATGDANASQVVKGNDSRLGTIINPPPPSARAGIPTTGALWGAYVGPKPSDTTGTTFTANINRVNALQTTMGRNLGVNRLFNTPTDGYTTAHRANEMAEDARVGRTSIVSWRCPQGQTWASMAANSSAMATLANQLGTFTHDIVVCFDHEMDRTANDHSSSAATTPAAARAEYAAWITQQFSWIRQLAPSVTTAVNFAGYPMSMGGQMTAAEARQFLPADADLDLLDLVAVNPYNVHAAGSGGPDLTVASLLNPWNTFCTGGQVTKPMGIFEAGCLLVTGERPAWTQSLYDYFPAHPNMKILCWFDYQAIGIGGANVANDWFMDDDSAVLNAHKTKAAQVYFKPSSGPSNPPPPPPPPPDPRAALLHWDTALANARSGGTSAYLGVLGDSLMEGYEATKRGFTIWEQVTRKLSTRGDAVVKWIPAGAGVFNSPDPTQWPGGQSPVRYSGTLNAGTTNGLSMHGQMVTGGWVEVDYYGDLCEVVYTQHPNSSTTPYAVTIDGVAPPGFNTLAANGVAIAAQRAAYGIVGNRGFHTLRITVPAGTLYLDGFRAYDAPSVAFGISKTGVRIEASGKSGFSAQTFAANNQTDIAWTNQSLDLVIIALGENDRVQNNRSTAEFKADLNTILLRIDGRCTNSNVGFLLVGWWDWPDTWIQALRDVAAAYDPVRVSVLDIRTYVPAAQVAQNAQPDGVHPNDRGAGTIAGILAWYLDLAQAPAPTSTTVTIDAQTTAEGRLGWPANLTFSAGSYVDTSTTNANDFQFHYRTHRRWFDAGTYEFKLLVDARTDTGFARVDFDGVQIGSDIDTYSTANAPVVISAGFLTVTDDQVGWHYIRIRKMGLKNAASTGYAVAFRNLTVNSGAVIPNNPPPPPPPVIQAALPTPGSAALGSSPIQVPSSAFYVSGVGNDSNPGTIGSPFATIARAINATTPQIQTIVLRGGVYHLGDTWTNKTIEIMNYPGETVWIDGSFPVSRTTGDMTGTNVLPGMTVGAWTQDGAGSSVYRKSGIVLNFDHTVTHPEQIDPAFPLAPWPEQVFVDGTPYTQVATRGALTAANQFFYDAAGDILYIFGNPAGKLVEVTYFQTNFNLYGVGSKIRGIGFRRYATSMSQFGALRMAADAIVVQNCRFEDHALTPIFVNGASVFLDQITSFRNGKAGAIGINASGTNVTNSVFTFNNSSHFATGQEAGGFKFSASTNMNVRNNICDDNIGHGMWLDVFADNATINRNKCRRNQSNGIMFEISRGATIVGNICTDNQSGINVATSTNAQVWNNTLLNNSTTQLLYEASGRTDSDTVIPNGAGTGTSIVPRNCMVRNNIFGSYTNAGQLQIVRDVRNTGRFYNEANQSDPANMLWNSDYNAYYRLSTGTSPKVAELDSANNTVPYTTLPALVSGTTPTQDAHSIHVENTGTDPYVTNRTSNYTPPAGSAVLNAGIPLGATVAAALGVDAGIPVDMGAVQI